MKKSKSLRWQGCGCDFLKYELINVHLFKRLCPVHSTSSFTYTKTSNPAVFNPGQYHHPSFAPLRRYMGICVMGHHNDWGTLLAFSGQGSGMRNILQHMGQSHTTKSCLTQDTSSNAINKMPRGRGQRPGLPKIHWKNPKIQPNTVTFITLWFLKKSNFFT